MPESVQASPLADGSFDGVAATAEGPPLAFASRTSHGVNTGQAWDLTTRTVLGPPIPDFPAERAEWTFGVPAGSPIVAWTHRDRVHVHDLGTGHELVLDGQPDLLGLAVHSGRAAVVAVFGPARDAEFVVWDAATGDRLAEFVLWLGHRTAIDRSLLHAVPASGPFVALTGGADAVVLDVERGGDIPITTPDGLIILQPDGNDLHVLGTDAVLTAPGPCGPATAARTGRLLVAAVLRDDPSTVLAWASTARAPSHLLKVTAPVNDLALAPDGTLLTATDEGLFTSRLP
ncbi:hypothetical protein GCM10022254_29330 [Actinomadura meridiana]|uniref:Uncharacterized protein n=1 Tax=Actinomadura meridiana TaxID=559626 RepID=A0ABP8C0V1_9ACTN